MAYDKVVDSAVLDAGLQSIADAIKAKGGTTDPLAFPDGMVAAVEAISAGDGIESGVSYEEIDSDGYLISAKVYGTEVPYKAFSNNSRLKTVNLAKGIEKIGTDAFSSCSNLTSIELPEGLTEIGDSAFSSCSNLKLKTLPSSVTKIVSYAFSYCYKITSIELPSSVTTIGSYVFNYCTGLSTVTFKGTPDSISKNALGSCANLKTINVPWSEGAVADAPWGATNATINYNYTGE